MTRRLVSPREAVATASLLAALAFVTLAMLAAAPAGATPTISSFTTSTSTTEAGAHPNLTTSFSFDDPGAPEAVKNVTFNAPRGVFGNPNAISQCSAADFALSSCPTNSQAGVVTVRASHGGDPGFVLGTAPLYDLEPGSETALFAFNVPTLNIPLSLPVEVRTGSDYGLRFRVSDISQVAPLSSVDFTLWGFPAADSNNPERFPPGSAAAPSGCPGSTEGICEGGQKSSDPIRPLISNPSVCTGQPLATVLEAESYQDSGRVSRATASYPPVTGCEKATFNPVLQAGLTTAEVDSPSGLNLILKAPQFESEATSPSQIRSVKLELPEGLTINPDAADGQVSCPDLAANFGSEQAANCPDNSKIGTFEMTTPALAGPLVGSLYIGEPKPGNQYRLFMVADGFGIHAKLVATILPDPASGRLTIQTGELPQVPFEEFRLRLFASDRGLMATPNYCTVYPASAQFFPWNETLADQTSTEFLGLDSGPAGTQCPGSLRPFSPRLAAGTANPTAGAFSDFTLKLDRDDGDQFLGDLNFRMPPGFTGSLRGIPYCPEAQIAIAVQTLGRAERLAPSCPQASLVGTTNVAAGPGGSPFNAAGRMYLAGPLKGAPISMVAITPALAGPYDYGNVVVRIALYVDPRTAQVSAFSERMPQIIGGIPIRMRSIQVSINRPNFTINPTNCSNFTVDSQGIGDQGTITNFSSPFTAVNCVTLPFRPRMAIKVLGKRKNARRNRNPVLRFDLRTRPGDANLRSVAVTLPKAFAIDQRHLGNICSKAQLEAEQCAGRQAIGRVRVKTPLLDAPLQGPAYAVSGFGKLPRLAFILDGQVRLVPQAESKSVKGGFLRTVVPVIPDAPIGHFRLTLLGGKKGYLVNTRNLCAAASTTKVRYVAQSGRRLTQRVRTRTPCAKKRRARSWHRAAGA